MANSKRKASVSKSQTTAKRRKAAPQKHAAVPSVRSDETIRKLSDHVNMCVARVNLLMQHSEFLQKKMYELATVTHRELASFHFELEELRSPAYTTQDEAYGAYDTYEMYPSAFAGAETTHTLDENIMSEEMLIEAVGDFADSLP